MYQVLSELNKTPGITGSMLVGKDGMVIVSDLSAGAESETVGALAASITTAIQKSLDRLDSEPWGQVTIEAENAKLFFTDVEVGVLVVTAEKQVNIGLVRLEIRNAAGQLSIAS